MKRGIMLGLILLCFFALSSAQTPDELANDPIAGKVLNTGERLTEFSESDNKTSYLLNEWTKVLETNAAGGVLVTISEFLQKANPLVEKLIGWPYELSWAFFFALVLWFTIAGFVWRPLNALLNNNLLALIGSFVIASLVGLTGVIKKAVNLAAFAINNIWIALLAFIGAVIVALLFERLGKILGKKIKAAKEEAAKEKETRSRKVLNVDAKVAEKDLDSYKEGAD